MPEMGKFFTLKSDLSINDGIMYLLTAAIPGPIRGRPLRELAKWLKDMASILKASNRKDCIWKMTAATAAPAPSSCSSLS